MTVIEFEVNNGGDSGASCCGIKVKTDTAKLSYMVIASFGDGRNSVEECNAMRCGSAVNLTSNFF